MHLVEPTDSQCMLGLLPGDRLMKVDGEDMERCSQEEIIGKVVAAGQ